MARVNHKKVKRLIAEKRKTITDRQFFTSRVMASHLEDMAMAQTRRYHHSRRIKVKIVWQPKEQNLAMTNNDLIWINAGNKMITQNRDRQDRYDSICGLFAHELGHILYTDFLASYTYMTRMASYTWYPEKPPLRSSLEDQYEDEIWAYMKDSDAKKKALLTTAHEINNILEDGYIDNKMMDRYPGILGNSLEFMRDICLEQSSTVTEMIEAELDERMHIWLSIQNIMCQYVRYGIIKYGEEPLNDERIQTVFKLMPELDRGVTTQSSKERWNITNRILIRCWPTIKEFLELCEHLSEDHASGGGDKVPMDEILKKLLSELSGRTEIGSGDSVPVEEPEKTSDSSADNRAATASQLAAASGASEDENEKEDEDENDDETAPKANHSDSESESPGSHLQAPLSSGEGEAPPTQEVSENEGGRIPLEQTNHLYDPMGGTCQHDDNYEGAGYTNSGKDIERLLESMATKAVHGTLEKQRTKKLNELASAISYGNIHAGINVVVHRIADVSDELKDDYKQVTAPLLHISKQLQRSVRQHLQDKRRGGKHTNLLMGRRLDAHALPRNDGRVFYKTSLPNEIPEIVVAYVGDESGSMSACDRATYNRSAAIIIYDFCRSLNIPVTIYGHSGGGGTVDLYSYAEFDSIDNDDCYRLMDISARSQNRDGAAIRYVADQISKRPEEIKLLFVTSDGQPADAGYSGTAAEEDLRGIKQEYTRKGVTFIAAAIGEDKVNIKRIYGDSFLDITDLSKLPIVLTQIIKKHIRI